MITPNRRVQFEAWFQRKIFTFWDSIYQSWLVLKRASIGTDVEALDSILAEKIPKNLKKSKYKRNMNYPSGPARYDCTGPKWMELLNPGGRGNLNKNPKSPRIRNKFACYFYFNY